MSAITEPTYKCSQCNQDLYSDEVQEHTRAEIDKGLLEDICKPKPEAIKNLVDAIYELE